MAKAGEVEVFRITPEVGKCYEHIEATRTDPNAGRFTSYFSTNQPTYVGKYIHSYSKGELIEEIEIPGGHGRTRREIVERATTYDVFDDNGKETRIKYSEEGNTCFIEVPCKTQGGMRKHFKNTRRKLKIRKHRK